MSGSVSMIDGHIDEVLKAVNTRTTEVKEGEFRIETTCLICKESIEVFGFYETNKVCEKCRAAVMQVRRRIGLEG